MRFVGKSKIGRLSAKKGKVYAQIRLPPQLADTIGEIANIFETEHNGKRAFLLLMKRSMSDDDMVLQLDERVVKSEDYNDYDHRLCALESEINELKSIIFSNERPLGTRRYNRKRRAGRSKSHHGGLLNYWPLGHGTHSLLPIAR